MVQLSKAGTASHYWCVCYFTSRHDKVPSERKTNMFQHKGDSNTRLVRLWVNSLLREHAGVIDEMLVGAPENTAPSKHKPSLKPHCIGILEWIPFSGYSTLGHVLKENMKHLHNELGSAFTVVHFQLFYIDLGAILYSVHDVIKFANAQHVNLSLEDFREKK